MLPKNLKEENLGGIPKEEELLKDALLLKGPLPEGILRRVMKGTSEDLLPDRTRFEGLHKEDMMKGPKVSILKEKGNIRKDPHSSPREEDISKDLDSNHKEGEINKDMKDGSRIPRKTGVTLAKIIQMIE